MTVLVDKLEKELARNCRLNNWDLGFQAAIDIVKKHSEWVSADEQLPDKDGKYLVYCASPPHRRLRNFRETRRPRTRTSPPHRRLRNSGGAI